MLPKSKEKKQEEQQKKKAVFNMALNTLERLGNILEEIKKITHDNYLDAETRQRIKIDLVKQFYVQSTPLLPKKLIENENEKILNLKPVIKKIMENRTGSNPVFKGISNVFDYEMDKKLDEILIKLQIALNLEGYFMPSIKDTKYGWGEGD